MKKLIEHIKVIKDNYDKVNYICKGHDGKPFFGDIRISLNDGKIVFMKHKNDGEFEITETVKFYSQREGDGEY